MNERIRELAEQADKWSDEEFHRLFLANETPDRQKLFKTKFAELIVEECSLVCKMNPHFDNYQLANIVKIHFGVDLL